MGQAAIDLPDPMSAAPVSSANTDDLLAQLAGEEIERLLADADDTDRAAPVDQPPSPGPRATSTSTSAPKPAAAVSAAPVSSLLEAPPTAPAARPDPELELNALFAQLQEPEASSPAPPGPAPAPASTPPADEAPSAAEALAQEMLEDAAVSPGGRTSLSDEGSTRAAVSHAQGEDAAAAPLLLRVLGLISSPLDSYSDHVRDLIGKVAIVTTVNAAAVLAYVLFIRGH
jgi:hypothetical protein